MNHKILIELIFKTEKELLPLIKEKIVVQTRPFELGFKITNIGLEPMKGFTLKTIRLRSASGQDIIHDFEKSFRIDSLNPNDFKEIWIGKIGTYMHGLANVGLNIVPDIESDTIETYQRDHFTKEISNNSTKNSWLDFLYIQSRTEYIQNFSNYLMIYLMLLTVVLAFMNLLFLYLQIKSHLIKL